MRRAALAARLSSRSPSPPAAGPGAGAVYQQQQKQAFRFAGDALARYEWTRDILVRPDAPETAATRTAASSRRRPRLELTFGPVELGVGRCLQLQRRRERRARRRADDPSLIRDNYRSRDARLDLAYGERELGPVAWQGGRFVMPLPLTEMIWDGTCGRRAAPSRSRSRRRQSSHEPIRAHGLYATGSHVYEDESMMYGGGRGAAASGPAATRGLQLVGSYLQFDDLDKLRARHPPPEHAGRAA